MVGLVALQKITSHVRRQNVLSLIQEKCFNSVRIFWLDRAKAIEVLRAKAREYVNANKNVLKVVLFGSLAEGRALPGSDADILILLETSQQDFLSRMDGPLNIFSGLGIGIEVFPYTCTEAAGIPLVRKALEQGLVLAAR